MPIVNITTPLTLSRFVDAYRGEAERVNLYSEGCNILLLEFAGDVALNEGGLVIMVSIWATSKLCIPYLASTTITNKHELEGWDAGCCGVCHSVVCVVKFGWRCTTEYSSSVSGCRI